MTQSHRWIATEAPLAGRYDDCFFVSETLGWAINGSGNVYRTDDGAKTWQQQQHFKNSYLRCMGMANENIGWIGCTTKKTPMYFTRNGGAKWLPVTNLPRTYQSPLNADAPEAVCGLHVLDEKHIYASGANNPEVPARFMKSTDGGVTWQSRDMEDVATCLIDIFFQTPDVGWIVGGRATRPHSRRSDVLPVVLKTEDGGQTWVNTVGPEVQAPLGEWGWKIQFVTDDFVVVALENFKAGAILISENGGTSWVRQEIRNASGEMINGNLEGVGFLDRQTGWVGGWGDVAVSSGRTSGTVDGGRTWSNLTNTWPKPLMEDHCLADVDQGQYLNRFRFIGNFGYASGNTVYKYTDEAVQEFDHRPPQPGLLFAAEGNIPFTDSASIPITVQPGTKSLNIEIYDRFAGKVKTLLNETNPSSGQQTLSWDLTDDSGKPVDARQHLVRVVADNHSESRMMFREEPPSTASRRHPSHMLHSLDEV